MWYRKCTFNCSRGQVRGHKTESMHAGMLQTEEVILRVAEADKDDVDLAVNAARKAFDKGAWPRTPGAQRGLVLNKCAGLLP